jgi:cysteine desulfurase / selenocysteine lyase
MAHEVDFERASMEHGALKFQAGTPDVAGPVGLAAAMDFLTTIGRDSTWRHDQELVRHGLERLREVKGLRLIGPAAPDNRLPVFTFAIAGKSPLAIATALDSKGIAIRAGDMAALPLLKRFGVSEAARASAYVYSSKDDIDRLADGLAAQI